MNLSLSISLFVCLSQPVFSSVTQSATLYVSTYVFVKLLVQVLVLTWLESQWVLWVLVSLKESQWVLMSLGDAQWVLVRLNESWSVSLTLIRTHWDSSSLLFLLVCDRFWWFDSSGNLSWANLSIPKTVLAFIGTKMMLFKLCFGLHNCLKAH